MILPCITGHSEVDADRSNQGADIVIALSHLGYGGGTDIYYYDTGIIPKTRNIDMIIGGHSHTTLYNARYISDLDGNQIPVVQTEPKKR